MLLLVCALAAAYCLTLLVIEHRVHAQEAGLSSFGLPLVLIGKPFLALGVATQALYGVLTLIECALIYAIATLPDGSRPTLRIAVPIAVVVLVGSSLLTNFSNSDIYYYVYYGKTQSETDAYRPQDVRVAQPTLSPLRRVVSDRIPSVYGPVWQAWDRAVVEPAGTLADAVRLERLSSAAMLMITFVLVAALRLPAPLTAAIVLNPALYFSYVVQAHNDVYAIAATVAAALAMRTRAPVWAALFGSVAGALKLSLVFVAFAIVGSAASLRTRLALAAAIAVGFAALSWLLGGPDYVHAIVSVATTQKGRETSPMQHDVRVFVEGFATVLTASVVAAAILRRRFYPWGSLIFAGASALVQPWYFPWGLAYAVQTARAILLFCTILPFLAFVTDAGLTDAVSVHVTTAIVALISLALVRDVVIQYKGRKSSSMRRSSVAYE